MNDDEMRDDELQEGGEEKLPSGFHLSDASDIDDDESEIDPKTNEEELDGEEEEEEEGDDEEEGEEY